ncbi:hypothetical protein [Leptospira adleri]|uniref:hypothetical protein n=1 Tax=Leptospira adleri TaxID=2023186 RepID=UPI0013FDBD4D|nr:hypothetical protein [Leptospira adleri]
MSTNDPFFANRSDFSEFEPIELKGPIDPSVLSLLAGEFFGPLPMNGGTGVEKVGA